MVRTMATGFETFSKEMVSEAMRFRIPMAASSVGARKKIQVKQTKFTVTKIRAILRQPGAGVRDLLWKARVMASAAPCSNPQIAKFQLAPCQRPPSVMVKTRLK